MTEPPYRSLSTARLVVGIPTVPRERDYIGETVDHIVRGVAESAWERVKIVILDASTAGTHHPAVDAVGARYPELVRSGRLILIRNPSGHPILDAPHHAQDEDWRTWRHKVVLDFAYLTGFCADLGDYYLHVEDDAIAASEFLVELTTWFDQHYATRSDWGFLSLFSPRRVPDHQRIAPDEVGTACALFLRCRDLNHVSTFCVENYRTNPLDWLLGDWLRVSGRDAYAHSPPLFQHVGLFSSLGNETRPVQAPDFREPWKSTARRALADASALVQRQPGELVRLLRWRLPSLVPGMDRASDWFRRIFGSGPP